MKILQNIVAPASPAGPAVMLLGTLVGLNVPAPVAGAGAQVGPGLAGNSPATCFHDATTELGLPARPEQPASERPFILQTTGAGAGALDFDRDGRTDLVLAGPGALSRVAERAAELLPGPPDRLFRNVGAGFREVPGALGIPAWTTAVTVGDIDNDGFPDLFLSRFGPNRLYRNLGDGTFTPWDEGGDLADDQWASSAAFADIDNDGLLDLYVTNYVRLRLEDLPLPGDGSHCVFFGVPVACGPRGLEAATHLLLRNEGTRLVEWQREVVRWRRAYGLGVVPVDIEDDGDLDLYVANDSVANMLWRNDGGELVEVGLGAGVALSGNGTEQAGMGIDAGDVDGDGLPDLYVTNFSHDSNTLYMNVGDGLFVDRTVAAGHGHSTLPYLGWATQLLDVDADGDLDALVLNGHTYPEVEAADLGTSYRQPPLLFVNDGHGRFAGGPMHVDGELPAWSARGAALADIDGDGDLDVLATRLDGGPLVLRADDSCPRRWLGLRLTGGPASNRDAIGARVEVELDDGRRLVRWVRRAGGYLSAHDPAILLGLGDDAGALRATVRWPDGATEEIQPTPGAWNLVHQGRGVVAVRAGAAASVGACPPCPRDSPGH